MQTRVQKLSVSMDYLKHSDKQVTPQKKHRESVENIFLYSSCSNTITQLFSTNMLQCERFFAEIPQVFPGLSAIAQDGDRVKFSLQASKVDAG